MASLGDLRDSFYQVVKVLDDDLREILRWGVLGSEKLGAWCWVQLSCIHNTSFNVCYFQIWIVLLNDLVKGYAFLNKPEYILNRDTGICYTRLSEMDSCVDHYSIFVFILVGYCLLSFDFLLAYGCLLLRARCRVTQVNGLLKNLTHISWVVM